MGPRSRRGRPRPGTGGHLGEVHRSGLSGPGPFASHATRRGSSGCTSTTSRWNCCAAISARSAASTSNRNKFGALEREYTYADGSAAGLLRSRGPGSRSWMRRASTKCCSIRPSASAGRATSTIRRWRRPTPGPTTAGSRISAATTRAPPARGAHLAHRPGGSGGGGHPGAQGRLRGRVPVPGCPGPQRAAAIGPSPRAVLGDGPGTSTCRLASTSWCASRTLSTTCPTRWATASSSSPSWPST